MLRTSRLLSKQGTVMMDSGAARDGPAEGATTAESASFVEIDKPVFMKETVRLGPFQTQILECRTKPLLGESAYVMVTPLKAGKSQPGGVQPLPPRLHVLHAYILKFFYLFIYVCIHVINQTFRQVDIKIVKHMRL